MAKRIAIETVDRSLQDITGIQKPFGGKVVVLGGEFMQVLPVVPKATIQETINSSLVKSYLYKQMQHLTLTENMRSKPDPVFSDFLLQIGSGIEPTDSEGNIKIPDEMIIKYSKNDEESYEVMLINHTFPNLKENAESTEYMTSRAILTSINEYVDKLNEKIIHFFQGEGKTYASFDETVDDTHNFYPQEFLNTLTPNGMPPHRLVLQKNCTIMLLRKLDSSEGLCNRTQMVCKEFEDNVIHAEITVGHHAGKHVFIPRIPLSPAENEGYPFQLRRKQFPIRLYFAMTINKAQGQTIPIVGIYLPQPVFSHGQLYVALSKGTSMSATKVLIKPNSIKNVDDARTKNVVFKEILRQDHETATVKGKEWK
ncbi:ATP-dependent DNA helicase PIF1-like [Primulina huaijiensis]|uniref:ATP-dependent DNA helicase PIF1-like n=1 Tax=Primulina huaijiensis TaxID=1492673 RepID=UPI003CC6EB47